MAGRFEHSMLVPADTTATAHTGPGRADESARNRMAETDEMEIPTPEAGDSLALGEEIIPGDSLAGGDSVCLTEPQRPSDPAGLIGRYDQIDMMPWFGAATTSDAASDGPMQWPVAWRDTTARAVFGNTSILAEPHGTTSDKAAAPTDNASFQCFVLALAAVYAILIYRNFNDIAALLSRLFHDASPGKRLTEESGNSGFTHFLRITNIIGLLALGLPVVKFGGGMIPRIPDGLLADNIMLILSIATSLAAGAVMLYQRLVLQSAGAITVSQPFIAQLMQLKRTCFALAVVFALPVLLLFVLTTAETGKIWLYLFLAESALAIILYLKESLALFLSKNFSILHWFLYLCTVDVFPISLIWLLITREYAPL